MRVLFLTASYPTPERPAPGVFVREHARAAATAGWDVGVVHLERTDVRSLRVRRGPGDEFPTVHVAYPRRPLVASYAANLAATRAGWRALRRIGFAPDVVHAHFFLAGVPAVLLRPLHRLPVVVSEHWSVFLPEDPATLGPLPRRAAKLAFERADLVLPVSEALRDGIRAAGIDASFRVVPNAFDPALFAPPERPTFDERPARVLAVGGLYEAKGYEYLLEAAAVLAAGRDDFRIEILGDGPDRGRYERLRTELGVDELVVFRGWQDRAAVATAMRDADLFVLPSRYDNNPCAVIEALGSGLPVVATAVGGVPELVGEESGLLVPPRDASALARGIASLLDRRSAYDREQIADRARARYSREVVGRALAAAYADAIAGRSRDA